MSDSLNLNWLRLNATRSQKDGLSAFGKSGYDESKDTLDESIDISKLKGNLDNFIKSDLANALNKKELDSIFKILDSDSNGTLSQAELEVLARLGSSSETGKIDNSDISALHKIAQQYGAESELEDAWAKFADSGYNSEKDLLETEIELSQLTGEITDFLNSDLGYALNKKQLMSVFKILDENNDGKLDQSEVKKLAEMGSSSSTDKVDDSDIYALFKTAQEKVQQTTTTEQPTRIENSDGSVTYIQTDSEGNTIKKTVYTDGSQLVLKYNKFEQKVSSQKTETDGSTKTENWTYNTMGDVSRYTCLKTTKENGKDVLSSYTDTRYYTDGSKVSATKKGNGNESLVYYDSNGKKTKAYSYDASAQTTTATDYVDGKASSAVRKDANGNVVRTDNYKYTAAGVLESKVSTKADGTKTTYNYDSTGKKIVSGKTEDASGNVTSEFAYTYNSDGSKTKTTKNANGNTSTIKYDSSGKKVSAESYNASSKTTTKTTYVDGKADTATVTDANNKVVKTNKYHYNAAGKLDSMSQTRSDGTSAEYNYDQTTGKLSSSVIKNAKGVVTEENTYNPETGKIKAKSKYTYDSSGNKTKTYNYTYDSNGKVKTRDIYDKNGNHIQTSTYTHNSDGSRVRTDTNVSTGAKTVNNINKDGKVTSKTVQDKNGKTTSYSEYSYYSDGTKKSDTTVKYNSNVPYFTRTITKYDEKGNKTGSSSRTGFIAPLILVQAKYPGYKISGDKILDSSGNLIGMIRTASGSQQYYLFK